MYQSTILANLEADRVSGRISDAGKVQVEHTTYVDVPGRHVDRIFAQRLRELRGQFWVKRMKHWPDDSDELGWYVTHDMRGRGSDIDEYIAPYDDPRFELQRAVYELEQLLKVRADLRNRK